jgi:hypothetical protein
MGLAWNAPSLGLVLGLALKAPSLNKGKVEGLTPLLLSPILDTLASALTGITSRTGITGSIAGQEGDDSRFVYESGRIPSMPARGHMANTTGLLRLKPENPISSADSPVNPLVGCRGVIS